MKDTFGKIWTKLKHFGLEVFAFISSKLFIKNFAGILAMSLFFLFMTTTWLKCYTNHGEGIHMANFEGMNLLDVKDYAKEQGFTIVVDSVDIGKNPLEVIEQHPKPDALVKEKRTVYLRVQQIKKNAKKIPKLTGANEDADKYSEALKRANFLVSREYKLDSRVAENTVLKIFYKEEDITDKVRDNKMEKIPRGSTLKLIVSERGYTNTSVPNIVCKNYEEARFILESNNLVVGSIDSDQTINDKYTSYVWHQDPKAGSPIKYGESVKFRITQYLPDDCEENQLEAPRPDDKPENKKPEEESEEDEEESEEDENEDF